MLVGTLLAPGARKVAAALWVMGLSGERHFTNYHRVLNRATGITQYLLRGGKLEHAQHMAAHGSSRTTELYDRRTDEVTLDEVERIMLASKETPAGRLTNV